MPLAVEEQQQQHTAPSYDESLPLPPGAAEYLRRDNPRLLELKQRYSALQLPMSVHTYWSDSRLQNDLQLGYFRGDNVYVWQLRNVRDSARMRYFLFTQYIASHDPAGLLNKLGEDGQFGAYTFKYEGYPLASRDHILLSISDDGKGMDPEILRAKAVEKGLLDKDAADRLSETECYNLIFAPGFSTKTEISDVSGRGVGMDVVKTKISQLNGTVNLFSQKGAGSKIVIKVP